jgi:hypothetical protein
MKRIAVVHFLSGHRIDGCAALLLQKKSHRLCSSFVSNLPGRNLLLNKHVRRYLGKLLLRQWSFCERVWIRDIKLFRRLGPVTTPITAP